MPQYRAGQEALKNHSLCAIVLSSIWDLVILPPSPMFPIPPPYFLFLLRSSFLSIHSSPLFPLSSILPPSSFLIPASSFLLSPPRPLPPFFLLHPSSLLLPPSFFLLRPPSFSLCFSQGCCCMSLGMRATCIYIRHRACPGRAFVVFSLGWSILAFTLSRLFRF